MEILEKCLKKYIKGFLKHSRRISEKKTLKDFQKESMYKRQHKYSVFHWIHSHWIISEKKNMKNNLTQPMCGYLKELFCEISAWIPGGMFKNISEGYF